MTIGRTKRRSKNTIGRTKRFYIMGRIYTGSLLKALALASKDNPDIKQFWVWKP